MASRAWEAFNCYTILDLRPPVTPQDIKSAYRAACRKHHPDLGGSHDTMVRVNHAYEVLSDPVARVSHDLYWRVRAASEGPPRPQPPPRPQRTPERPPAAGRAAEPPGEARPRAAPVDPMGRVRARVRERIIEEGAKIRETRAARAEKIYGDFLRSLTSTRSSLAGTLVGAVLLAGLGLKWPLAWLGTAVAAFAFIGNLRGPAINGAFRSPLVPCGSWAKEQASAKAAADVERDVDGLERYVSDLAALVELVMRGSTFDHSESQVARRITTAFFLLGYTALSYSDSERTLLFSDGDERLLVRFRHRDGAAVNVTVPQRLAAAMQQNGIKRGYLFCSPGLSGNAATFAAAHNIRAYTMEEMNEWVDEALAADYGGPAGDILANLDALKEFLSRLSRNLPAHSGRSSGWPRRRRRRRYW